MIHEEACPGFGLFFKPCHEMSGFFGPGIRVDKVEGCGMKRVVYFGDLIDIARVDG